MQGRRIFSVIMYELGGHEFLDAAAKWCVQNPDMAICVLAAVLVFLLPLLIIFGIGIMTMLITFTGILVLEGNWICIFACLITAKRIICIAGTLLTVIFMIFFACIGSLVISMAVLAVIAYFGFAQIYGFFGMDRHRESFIKFVQQNRRTSDAGTANSEPSCI